MSGGAFDYAQYRIDDIINRIEEEIDRATCERPSLVTKQGVAVYELFENEGKRYCYNYRFTCFDSAVDYFTKCENYQLLKGASREGETFVHFKDVYTGEVYEVKSYTYEEYEPDEDGDIPYFPDYSEETIKELRKGLDMIKRASVYTRRIDQLIIGEDSEETFHKRLKEKLKELEEE